MASERIDCGHLNHLGTGCVCRDERCLTMRDDIVSRLRAAGLTPNLVLNVLAAHGVVTVGGVLTGASPDDPRPRIKPESPDTIWR